MKKENEKDYIFDKFRKKYVILTPEEWVRQHFAYYLTEEKKYPENLLVVEGAVKINQQTKRADIVAYNRSGKAIMIVECKAASVKITQETFDQIATYNLNLGVQYLVVTNGLQHYCCIIDQARKRYQFLQDIPEFTA